MSNVPVLYARLLRLLIFLLLRLRLLLRLCLFLQASAAEAITSGVRDSLIKKINAGLEVHSNKT